MEIRGAVSIGAAAGAYKPAEENIVKLCLNTFTSGCPRGFKVVVRALRVFIRLQKLEDIDFTNKTLLFRPKRAVCSLPGNGLSYFLGFDVGGGCEGCWRAQGTCYGC